MGLTSRIIGLWLCFLLFTTVNSLIIDSTNEGTCEDLKNVTLATVDMNWFNSIETWYLSAGSVHHLYSTALHFFGDDEAVIESIPEYRFYYQACFTMRSSGTQAILRGFEPGRMTYHNISMAENGAIDYIHLKQDGGISDVSRVYMTLTDNQSFVFLTSCELYANYKGWGVVSTAPRLSPAAIRSIEEHATAQGFDKKYFAFLQYNSCQPGVVLSNYLSGSGQNALQMNNSGQNKIVSKGRGFHGVRRMNNRW